MQRRTFLTTLGIFGVCPLCTNLAIAAESTHWSYSGHSGPDRWGLLDKANATCSAGTQQSPLNITESIEATIPALSMTWKNGGRMVNNGHTIQINMPPGSVLRRGEQSYELLQYHFHHPSEHLVDGNRFAMEVHFVHKKNDSRTSACSALCWYRELSTQPSRN
jgi:carbonic anhydrase